MSTRKPDTPPVQSGKSQELYTLLGTRKWGRLRRARREKMIFNFISRHLKPGATILEVGSGRGEFARIARGHGFRYIGIEPSSAMRQELLDDGFEILPGEVPKIDLADESVDLVHSNALLEHLENYPTVLAFYREARRILRSGGLLSSIIPNCDTIGMIFYLQDYQHNFVTNLGRLEHLSRDTGLETVTSRSFLTNLGLRPPYFIDRIFAQSILLVMRSPVAYAIVRTLTGDDLSTRIYKNLFDQTIVISRKV